jgi:peptidoglycan/xylan/chitin deacetylase (PgdA/CDA1 family)
MVVPILLYHSIADEVSPLYRKWAVSPQQLAAHLGYLSSAGYTPLTVSQLTQIITDENSYIPVRPIVLTFDDGLADFYTGALPLLVQHEFVATLYVPTGYVGGVSEWLAANGEGTRPMMSWTQIVKLPMVGIEVGSHAHTHRQLDTLPISEARYEIARSKTILEQKLGRRVMTFAYPQGYYSWRERELVKEAGFTSACATKQALSATHDDRFSLARIEISNNIDVAGLTRLLSGAGLAVAPQREAIRTKVWRLVRRSRNLHPTIQSLW